MDLDGYMGAVVAVMIMIAGVGFACMIFEFPVFMYRVFKVVTPMGTFEKDTYFSTIYLVNDEGKTVTIDSRPSDAIAVAIRVDASIFVSAKVLADGSVSCDSAKDEEESQEFRNFIQSIKPSDFERLLKDDKSSDQ